ncbi:Type II secretory pathway, ATPase PulE/Tfp pilus assembly pathway, ATPase PilB [Enhygromyxa salina]|uniref:Type II secretory pathway, ATPase PulE/Tfp pilus assembly pathway, ATPase PilB n=1 Tax=Enhygromyxa salina TaxID=215803 RepID=A0A0C2DAB8_9BACT|nr:AAA family ATPase [Enhygromyxa salina]KIG16842.1 Type II secretory pathway, ATPase PulE/Tfp pilus assembly pathway, ATPase PilB [Enhygromyxa salina]
MDDFARARSSTEAFWAFDPFAVVVPDDPRFADIEKDLPREHFGVAAPVHRYFNDPARKRGSVKFAVIGHQGMGKTTLLRKAMADLRPLGIMPVYIDALTAFDQGDLLLPDLILVVAREVISVLSDQGIALDAAIVDATYHWFADELLTRTYATQIEASIGTGAQAGVDLPLLAKFSGRFAASLKTDNEYRKVIRQHAVRDVNELIRRVNILLDGAHAALAGRSQQLCVVFDNLEKLIDRDMVAKAVLAPAQELRGLRVHMVLFLHPADDYAPTHVAASQAYDVVNIPSLPVRFKGDPVDLVRPEAARAIRRLLEARVVLDDVFAEPDRALTLLAATSGGHIRDLLRLARRATELAEPRKVELEHIEAAGRWLSGHRTPLMTAEDWRRAVPIHRTHAIQNSAADAHMLLHSCVLFYDGEPWWDLHPVVRNDPGFARAQLEVDASE